MFVQNSMPKEYAVKQPSSLIWVFFHWRVWYTRLNNLEFAEVKKMKQTKNILSWLIIALNIVGVVCLIYFAIPYFTYNVTITNPDAMLPAEAWDSAGMVLTFGFIPLLVANIFCSVVVKTKQKFVSFLYFIPSVVCLIIVLSYWIPAL